MSSLEIAKKNLERANGAGDIAQQEFLIAVAEVHALVSIAESLEALTDILETKIYPAMGNT